MFEKSAGPVTASWYSAGKSGSRGSLSVLLAIRQRTGGPPRARRFPTSDNGQVKGTKGTLREENRLTVGTLALHVDEARRLGESLGVGHAAASANNANSASRAFVYPIRIPTVISRDPSAHEDYHST